MIVFKKSLRSNCLILFVWLGMAAVVAGCAGAPELRSAEDGQQAAAPATLLRLGDRTRDAGNLGIAAGMYRQAHEANPADPVPLLRLGQVLRKDGQHDAAVAAFQAVLALAPDHLEAHIGLGFALIALEKPTAALAHFDAAAALDSGGDERIFNGKGVAQDFLGHHAAAQALYRAGLAQAPGSAKLRNNLGMSLILSGQYGEAIATLKRIVIDAAASPLNRQNLALAYGLLERQNQGSTKRAPGGFLPAWLESDFGAGAPRSQDGGGNVAATSVKSSGQAGQAQEIQAQSPDMVLPTTVAQSARRSAALAAWAAVQAAQAAGHAAGVWRPDVFAVADYAKIKLSRAPARDAGTEPLRLVWSERIAAWAVGQAARASSHPADDGTETLWTRLAVVAVAEPSLDWLPSVTVPLRLSDDAELLTTADAGGEIQKKEPTRTQRNISAPAGFDGAYGTRPATRSFAGTVAIATWTSRLLPNHRVSVRGLTLAR